jgi:hypothetical protein
MGCGDFEVLPHKREAPHQFRAELFNAINHPQFQDPVIAPANNRQSAKSV